MVVKALVPLVERIAKAALKYKNQGYGKWAARKKIATLKEFTNNENALYKWDSSRNRWDYGTTFDTAWKKIGGKEDPTAAARFMAARHGKTAKEKEKISKKISETVKGKMARDEWHELKKGKPQFWQESSIDPVAVDESIIAGLERKVEAGLGSPYRGEKETVKGLGALLRSKYLKQKEKLRGLTEKQQKEGMENLMSWLTQHERLMRQRRDISPFLPSIKKAGEDVSEMMAESKKVGTKMNKTIQLYLNFLNKRKKAAGEKPVDEDWFWAHVPGNYAHPAAIKQNLKNFLKSKDPLTKRTSWELHTQPEWLTKFQAEIGPINWGKDSVENFLMGAIRDPNVKVTQQGLREFKKIFDFSGTQSIMPGPTGRKMFLGKNVPEQQRKFLDVSLEQDLAPFQLRGNRKKKFLEILSGEKSFEDVFNIPRKLRFQAGGLVSLIGKKALQKLLKKLSKKEIDLIKGSLWKGVDPKKSSRYRAWAKDRFAPGYKWPWARSRVRGPEGKGHFTDLEPGESVALQSKYADRMWEHQMKKKLNLPVREKLEYPFLNPENDAFIATGPREGLGRYQLRRHLSDAEKEMMETAKQDYPQVLEPRHFKDFRKKMKEKRQDVGPVDKYAVYDWWDEIMNRMRKKPKFKYVKDAKGNIILKEVK